VNNEEDYKSSMSSDAENQNANILDGGGKKPLPTGLPDVNTNRQTLNVAELSDSQPKLVNSEKSLPFLDFGEQQVVSTDPISIPRRTGRSTPCSSPRSNMNNSVGSPGCGFSLPIPSPLITKRNRTPSTCERAMGNPIERGTIRYFSRTKGHGFIANESGGEDVFVHISDIEGEFIPRVGDEVTYRLCAIPPKVEKFQAIHVRITHFTPEIHLKWDTPVEELEKQ